MEAEGVVRAEGVAEAGGVMDAEAEGGVDNRGNPACRSVTLPTRGRSLSCGCCWFRIRPTGAVVTARTRPTVIPFALGGAAVSWAGAGQGGAGARGEE